MRIFSEFEKKIIERMIELDEKSGSLNVLGNIFDSFSEELSLPDYCYIKVKSETDASIQIKKDIIDQIDPNTLRVLDDELSKFLLTTVKLFEYLENNGLAYFLGNLELESLGQVWANTEYVSCEFLEEESKTLLNKYTKKKIYVTEELRELVRNKFKPQERIRWERELFHTRVAVLITFLGLLASILVPLLSTSIVEIKNQTKTGIIEIELKNINSELKKVSNVINRATVGAVEVKNDMSKDLSEIKSIISRLETDKGKRSKKE